MKFMRRRGKMVCYVRQIDGDVGVWTKPRKTHHEDRNEWPRAQVNMTLRENDIITVWCGSVVLEVLERNPNNNKRYYLCGTYEDKVGKIDFSSLSKDARVCWNACNVIRTNRLEASDYVVGATAPEEPEPAVVTGISWSCGENNTPVPNNHPFYVDLNLHVTTERGGVVEGVVIKRNDGKELFGDQKEYLLEPKTCGEGNVAVYDNVLEELKLNLNRNNEPITIVTEKGDDASITINRPRPRWKDVYEGYPLIDWEKEYFWGETYNNEVKNWKERRQPSSNITVTDELPENVFMGILGEGYNKKIFTNACATRVSIALLGGGMDIGAGMPIERTPEIKMGKFTKRRFILSAKELRVWLEKTWGSADIKIYGRYINGVNIQQRTDLFGNAMKIVCNDETPVDIEPIKGEYDNNIINFVHEKISGTETKKGVYVIEGGISGVTGHTTLWVDKKVIARRTSESYSEKVGTTIPSSSGTESHAATTIRKGGVIYFWGLK